MFGEYESILDRHSRIRCEQEKIERSSDSLERYRLRRGSGLELRYRRPDGKKKLHV